jgi:hypothetical protein
VAAGKSHPEEGGQEWNIEGLSRSREGQMETQNNRDGQTDKRAYRYYDEQAVVT